LFWAVIFGRLKTKAEMRARRNDAPGFLSFDTQGELKLMLASIGLENRVDLLHGLIGRVDSVDGESLGAAR
jgi:hypothetical protein